MNPTAEIPIGVPPTLSRTTTIGTTQGHGGNITFSPGHGREANERDGQLLPKLPDGSMIFKLADGTEMMRFDPDGTVTIRGQVMPPTNDNIHRAFRDWLRGATYAAPEACKPDFTIN